MKKFLSKLFASVLVTLAVFGVAACGKSGGNTNGSSSDGSSSGGSGNGSLSGSSSSSSTIELQKDAEIYMPDGAPALAMAKFMAEDMEDTDFHVVDATTIQTYVTGANPKADLCVMPLNAAVKLLGSGETYQMLGTVTHGNLYLISTDGNTVYDEPSDLSGLIGKKVGTIQIQNVPGLTFKMILDKNDVPYQVIAANAEPAADKVNLIAVAPADITPALGYDAYLIAEPAASAKIKGTASTPKPFKLVGDLQKLYGGENGYPQAVLVGKTSFVQQNVQWVNSFLSQMPEAASWLTAETTEISTIVSAVQENLTEGMTPSFNAKNLTKAVISGCGVRFTAASADKAEVLAYLGYLNESAGLNLTAADEFFYE